MPVKPVSMYASPVPVVGVVFIQNGCPLALTMKVYVTPFTNERVGSAPTPSKMYASDPLLVI